MFKIPTQIRYSLRILLQLADAPEGAWVPVQRLAKDQAISPKYIEQILARLKKTALVSAREGAGGGYRLARPAAQIRTSEIFEAFAPSLALVDCLRKTEKCPMAPRCRTRRFWSKLDETLKAVLSGTRLSDL